MSIQDTAPIANSAAPKLRIDVARASSEDHYLNRHPLAHSHEVDRSFNDSEDVVADIVHYSRLSSNLATLRDSIKARVSNVIAESGVKQAQALKDLKQQVIAAGVNPRRASEVFIELGFRERTKQTSKSKIEKDERLNPVIEKLIALAEAEAGEDAVSALRRAYLTKQAKANA